MTAAQAERRLRRSQDRARAASLFLQAEAARLGARAMAVGTLDGLPIAAYGPVDPLLLSALGSLRARGETGAGPDNGVSDLQAIVIDLGDDRAVLSSCGAAPRARAAAHLRRILC